MLPARGESNFESRPEGDVMTSLAETVYLPSSKRSWGYRLKPIERLRPKNKSADSAEIKSGDRWGTRLKKCNPLTTGDCFCRPCRSTKTQILPLRGPTRGTTRNLQRAYIDASIFLFPLSTSPLIFRSPRSRDSFKPFLRTRQHDPAEVGRATPQRRRLIRARSSIETPNQDRHTLPHPRKEDTRAHAPTQNQRTHQQTHQNN